MNHQRNRGITLIALVISIVVLVMLAGVSVNLLFGNDGIITKAREGADNYLAAEQAEQGLLSELENTMNSLIPGEVRLPDLPEETEATRSMITKWDVTSGDEIEIYVYYAEDWNGDPIENNTNFSINWGDGTQETITSANMQYDGTDGYITHTYSTTNANTLITIDGICKVFSHSYNNKLTEVVQWGATGLQYLFVNGNTALTTLAVPTRNSFANMLGFDWAFCDCSGLTTIPENLFANISSDAITFEETFAECTGLTAIPANLFANCTNVESFYGTFNGCTKVEGNAPSLWGRVPNGSNNGYEGTPDGENCFAYCYSLNGYEYIPAYWGGLGVVPAPQVLPDLPTETVATTPMKTKWNITSGDTVSIRVYYSEDDLGNAIEKSNTFTIDWGDGTPIQTSSSINYFTESGLETGDVTHNYTATNSEIIITIDGYCPVFSLFSDGRITSVEQWGATGLRTIRLQGCYNLTTIATPTRNSFKDIMSFESSFYGCEGLTAIPENLFANASRATKFKLTFRECTSLTTIPQNLFGNCLRVTDFQYMFADCHNLTGNAPELWTRGSNREENGYQGLPTGEYCFTGCTNLNNLLNIPFNWRRSWPV